MKKADKFLMDSKTLTLITTLVFLPALSWAEGTSIGGGANSINGELVDKVISEKKWDPKTDPAFKEYVAPTLAYIRENLPHLADDLELILTKRWVKTDNAIAVNTSKDVALVSDQMAYQDKNVVIVDSGFYDKASPKARANAIFHELFQGLRIEKWLRNEQGKDEVGGVALALLSQQLFEREPKNAKEMQKLVARHLHNTYATTGQLEKFLKNQSGFSNLTAPLGMCAKKDSFFGPLSRVLEGLVRDDYASNGNEEYFRKGLSPFKGQVYRVLNVPEKDQAALDQDMFQRSYLAVTGKLPMVKGFYNEIPAKRDYTEFCNANLIPVDNGKVIFSKEFRLKRAPGANPSDAALSAPAAATEAK